MRRFSVALTLRVGSVATLLGLVAAIAPAGMVAAHATTPEQVSSTPASGTPRLATTSTATEVIKSLVPCGGQMYAVGTFPSVIGNGSKTLARPDAFSFSATAPYTVSTFALSFAFDASPQPVINTIAFNGSDCTHAYIGGKFTVTNTAGAVVVRNIAEISTTTGALVSSFGSNADGMVNTIASSGGHLLVGGQFDNINESHHVKRAYFVSLSPTTGLDDGYVPASLALAGLYSYTDDAGKTTVANATAVTNQQISPDGSRDLIEGDFMTIGAGPDNHRQQVAMIDLGSTAASLDTWNAPQYNAYCNFVAPDYAQAGAWSPDGSTVFIANSGYKPSTGTGYDATTPTASPRAGLCDSASSFPSTSTDPSGAVTSNWLNYTGCDSIYSVATDGANLYFAGHERWVDNSEGCDGAGPGAIAAEGIEGLSPSDGSLVADPTRARGQGADDMLFTSTGLWIASDNYNGSAACGGVANHAGLCLLPYTATVTQPGPFAAVPAVTGKAAVGQTLRCAEVSQPAGVTVAYRWLLGATPVSSAASYLIPARAYQQPLTCQVTVSRTGSPTMSASSTPAPVAKGASLQAAAAPELTQRPRAGHQVSARHGLWSPKATSYTYQWYLAGKAAKGGTKASYTPRHGTKGDRLRCVVTAHRSGYANGRASTEVRTVAAG